MDEHETSTMLLPNAHNDKEIINDCEMHAAKGHNKLVVLDPNTP